MKFRATPRELKQNPPAWKSQTKFSGKVRDPLFIALSMVIAEATKLPRKLKNGICWLNSTGSDRKVVFNESLLLWKLGPLTYVHAIEREKWPEK
jgi:hypothetical protein